MVDACGQLWILAVSCCRTAAGDGISSEGNRYDYRIRTRRRARHDPGLWAHPNDEAYLSASLMALVRPG